VGKGTELKKFKSLIPESAVFDDGITGFALYDPQDEEWLYQYQADKLFTPASNAKILTLYSALKYLGDSIAFAKIQQSNDTLTLYPMGDPTFLNPVFPQNSQLINRLSKQKGPFVISNSHFTGNRFGRGWAWDDFAFGFQPEISMFPVYGNLVHLHLSETGLLSVEPPYFSSFTLITKEPQKYGSKVSRDEFSNSFEFSVGKGRIKETTFRIPFNTYPYLMKELLEDTFDFEVSNIYPDRKFIEGDQQWNSIPLDTVLRRLMYHSDNFIAEQLLLQISAVELGYMNTDSIIGKLR
jgi:D-alanyl-D-alanine carboxypeptidase/D-alanyl-D-alanine-endopeptidase (penicillin-binding protein 4)